MGNDRIDLKYCKMLDNFGIHISAEGMPPYSWRARLYNRLPRWLQPLFPQLRAISDHETTRRGSYLMNAVIEKYDPDGRYSDEL